MESNNTSMFGQCFELCKNISKNSEFPVQEMLKFLWMSLSIIHNSAICVSCYECLHYDFTFVYSCLNVEEKIKEYREAEGTNSKGHIQLREVIHFISRNVSKYQNLNNSINVIKMGQYEQVVKNEHIKVEVKNEGLIRVEEHHLCGEDDDSQTSKGNNCDRSMGDENNMCLRSKQTVRMAPQKQHNTSGIECIQNTKPWTKKNMCPYCLFEVTHFPRHLRRNHETESTVKQLFSLPINDSRRKQLLNDIRRQGNFHLSTHDKRIRPIKRPRECVDEEVNNKESYVVCDFCLGFFKRNYLRRHRKKCALLKSVGDLSDKASHLSQSQVFSICSGRYKDFYGSLRLKDKVFKIMRNDNISKIAINDLLICSYGESKLTEERTVQTATIVSNRLRELARLLIVLRQTTCERRLIDVLKPEYYDDIVGATKCIAGYDEAARTFKAASLAAHMGTRLKQVCSIAYKLIAEKSRYFVSDNAEKSLEGIQDLKSLIQECWNLDVTRLTLKDKCSEFLKTKAISSNK